MPATREFTRNLPFPNGKGYTPCTKVYYDVYHDKMAICNPNAGESIDALSPEKYQRWSELDNDLMGMSLDGHLGTSVRD